jgi:hypothetical protein
VEERLKPGAKERHTHEMLKELETVEGLRAQEEELKLDASETATNLKAARADEKQWREQVEVYGQGQHRASLKAARENIAALEADAKANAEQLKSVTGQLATIEGRAGIIDRLKLKHDLTGAQAQKLKAKLEEGTPEKEVRALAAKWAPKSDLERHQNRLDDLAARDTPPVETPEEREQEREQERAHTSTAHAIAQEFGLSEAQHARLLSLLKNGSITPGAARDYGRELYQDASTGTPSGATPEAPKHGFQRAGDVAW